jgi:hypothetical protein
MIKINLLIAVLLFSSFGELEYRLPINTVNRKLTETLMLCLIAVTLIKWIKPHIKFIFLNNGLNGFVGVEINVRPFVYGGLTKPSLYWDNWIFFI